MLHWCFCMHSHINLMTDKQIHEGNWFGTAARTLVPLGHCWYKVWRCKTLEDLCIIQITRWMHQIVSSEKGVQTILQRGSLPRSIFERVLQRFHSQSIISYHISIYKYKNVICLWLLNHLYDLSLPLTCLLACIFTSGKISVKELVL